MSVFTPLSLLLGTLGLEALLGERDKRQVLKEQKRKTLGYSINVN